MLYSKGVTWAYRMMNLVQTAWWPRAQTLERDRLYLNFGSTTQLCNFGHTVYFPLLQITLGCNKVITILSHQLVL